MIQDLIQHSHELRPAAAQLRAMVDGELAQEVFAGGREEDVHLAPVPFRALATDETLPQGAVYELACAVVPDAKACRDLSDPETPVLRRFQGEEQLVLLGLEAEPARRLLREVEDSADL